MFHRRDVAHRRRGGINLFCATSGGTASAAPTRTRARARARGKKSVPSGVFDTVSRAFPPQCFHPVSGMDAVTGELRVEKRGGDWGSSNTAVCSLTRNLVRRKSPRNANPGCTWELKTLIHMPAVANPERGQTRRRSGRAFRFDYWTGGNAQIH